MIPALPGTVARFKDEGETWTQPVQAWSDDGDALITDGLASLMLASNDPDFIGVSNPTEPSSVSNDRSPIVGVVPTPGWEMTDSPPDGPSHDSERILGWAIRANGTAAPIRQLGDTLEGEVLDVSEAEPDGAGGLTFLWAHMEVRPS